MKSDYVTRAKKFLEDIYPYIRTCRTYRDYCGAINHFNADHNRKVFFHHGISRYALITSDYVIKFDYADKGTIEYYGGCENEVQLYEYAKTAGYDYLFAAITKITYHKKHYYIMPRIYGVGSAKHYIEHYLSLDEADFIKTVVEDLHDENFGFKNRRPVIIDYACKPIACSLW